MLFVYYVSLCQFTPSLTHLQEVQEVVVEFLHLHLGSLWMLHY